jgi:hypothetical protein
MRTNKKIKRTASLVVRMRKTCRQMEIELNLIEEKMITKMEDSEFATKTAVYIGCFLTQHII